MNGLDFTPVIVIGAGRSGTNVLRDTLCRLPDFATWDCDEINPIWRHGNLSISHDELRPRDASAPVRDFIRRRFASEWERRGRPRYLVEKTCANTLRVPFVAEVLPEARFVEIVRDGRDVIASASKRWRGEMELPWVPYYWSKVRNTPLADLPVYAGRFVRSHFAKLFARSNRLLLWGPQFAGMDALPKDIRLLELCARQWSRCVDASEDALASLPQDRRMSVRYEDFTRDPTATLVVICDFLGLDAEPAAIAAAVEPVSARSVGKGKRDVAEACAAVNDILGPSLERRGYRGI